MLVNLDTKMSKMVNHINSANEYQIVFIDWESIIKKVSPKTKPFNSLEENDKSKTDL